MGRDLIVVKHHNRRNTNKLYDSYHKANVTKTVLVTRHLKTETTKL